MEQIEVDVWHMKTPYGPLVVSRGHRGGAMSAHSHVRPHIVFALRGGYWEGDSLASRRRWDEGDVTIFPARYRHRSWFPDGEVMIAALRLTTLSIAELGLTALDRSSAARMDSDIRHALGTALIAARESTACAQLPLRVFAMIEAALVDIHRVAVDADWLDRARSELARDPVDPPPLRELAARVGRDPAYLSARFKRRYGVTVSQYLRRVRLLRASTLLADPRVSVTAAAHEAGFADASHLAHSFRKLSRTTASQFRASKAAGRSVTLRPN